MDYDFDSHIEIWIQNNASLQNEISMKEMVII